MFFSCIGLNLQIRFSVISQSFVVGHTSFLQLWNCSKVRLNTTIRFDNRFPYTGGFLWWMLQFTTYPVVWLDFWDLIVSPYHSCGIRWDRIKSLSSSPETLIKSQPSDFLMGLYNYFGLTLDLESFQFTSVARRNWNGNILQPNCLWMNFLKVCCLRLTPALDTLRHSTIFRMVASFLDRCHTIRFNTAIVGAVSFSLCGTVFTGVFHHFPSFSGCAAKIFDDLLLARSQLPAVRIQISGQKFGYPWPLLLFPA